MKVKCTEETMNINNNQRKVGTEINIILGKN